MMTQPKNLISVLTVVLFSLTFICDASIASDRSRRADVADIRACIVEINKKADYTDASRVMHWVVGLKQKNTAELEVRIETSVYTGSDAEPVKEYQSSCVTGPLGSLVRFRMHAPRISAG